MNPLISVIIPNYDHFSHLEERLYTVYNQTYPAFEVILLDDASTDNSVDILNEFKNHPKTSHFIINKKNSGSPFLQWKKGLSLAKGDFIWIAETDDSCETNFLESQLAKMESEKASVVVAETQKKTKKQLKGILEHPIFKTNASEILNLNYFLYCPILNVSAVLFKRTLVPPTATYSEYRLIGDRVFYFEAFQNEKIVLNTQTQSYCYRGKENVSSLSDKDLNYLIRYYQEHQKFARAALKENKIDRNLYQTYITRFFNRVNNRLSKSQKLSLLYIKLRMQFYQDLKCKK